MTNIKEFIHLYPGCGCTYDTINETGLIGVVTPKIIEWGMYGNVYSKVRNVQLHLRPLNDISEEEKKECDKQVHKYEHQLHSHITDWAYRIDWLLKQHFDLFGLIESGLAIDKNKITEKV